MKLELADRGGKKRIKVREYNRRANHVPSYYRKALRESSLFTVRLSDCGTSYLVVPDPHNQKAPRKVSFDLFTVLPEEEFCKVIDYVRDFNSTEAIDDAIVYYMETSLGDDAEDVNPAATDAFSFVDAIFTGPDQNDEESFWDKKWIFGIENKISLPIAALLLYRALK